MNIEEIRTHVTHFSEQLRFEGESGDDVIVGGEIKGIFPPFSDDDPRFMLLLDDHVGTSYVFLSQEVMVQYSDKLLVGGFVFIEGVLNIVTEDKRRNVSIFGYDVL